MQVTAARVSVVRAAVHRLMSRGFWMCSLVMGKSSKGGSTCCCSAAVIMTELVPPHLGYELLCEHADG